MRRNIKIILLIVGIALLILAASLFVLNKVRNSSVTPKESVPAGTNFDPSTLPSTGFSIPSTTSGNTKTAPMNVSNGKFTIPDKNAEKMIIPTTGGNIATNNLFKNPVESLPNNAVAFVENEEYHMSFYPNHQYFLITLLDPDIQKARDKAENDLLKTLGITKEQACNLDVDLGAPTWVSPEAEKAGAKNYGLSFCPNGKPFPK